LLALSTGRVNSRSKEKLTSFLERLSEAVYARIALPPVGAHAVIVVE
jgi:hypothetical protein